MKSNLLKAAMVSKGWTQRELVKHVNARGGSLSTSGLSQRLKGNVEFRQSEIDYISKALSLSPDQIRDIFFSACVS